MAYTIITALWLTLLPACLLVARFSCRTSRRIAPADWLSIGVIILVGVALNAEVFGPSFHGVEYEDAFEYIYSGLFMAVDASARGQSVNPICINGALASCGTVATLAHPVGLATLVSWMARAFGARLAYVHYISGISFVASGLISYGTARILGMLRRVALVAPLLLFTTSSFHALRVTSLSEPLSGALISGTVLLALVASAQGEESSVARRVALGAAIAITLALAITVRRENLLLCVVLPATLLWGATPDTRKEILRHTVAPCLAGGLVVLAATKIVDLGMVENSERSPLSLLNVLDLLPHFLRHIASFRRYGPLPWLVVAGSLASRTVRRCTPCVVLLVVYAVLFLLFGHSYYYEVLHEIPTFHFERYVVQIAPILAVVGALGTDAIVRTILRRWPSRDRRLPVLAFVAGTSIIVAMLSAGRRMRLEYAAEEQARIAPVTGACSTLPQGAALITSEPLLVGLFCGPNQAAVSFSSLPDQREARVHESVALFTVEEELSTVLQRTRYPEAARVLDLLPSTFHQEFRRGGRTYRVYRRN